MMELDYGQVGAVHLAAVHEAEQVLEHVGVSAVEVDALHPILDGVVLEEIGQLLVKTFFFVFSFRFVASQWTQ